MSGGPVTATAGRTFGGKFGNTGGAVDICMEGIGAIVVIDAGSDIDGLQRSSESKKATYN